MIETFPIQCTACHDILDVSVDVDVSMPQVCPMCGAEISVPQAEDFELECPEVLLRIEELTPTCLRLVWPVDLEWPTPRVAGTGLVFYGILSLSMGFSQMLSGFGGDADETLSIVFFLGLGLLLVSQGLFLLKGFYSIELSPDYLRRGFHIETVRYKRRWRVHSIRRVYMEQTKCYHVCVTYRSKTRVLHSSKQPDTPRYITHLLRRQLTQMGHPLNNGRR